jgi:GTP-binding protein
VIDFRKTTFIKTVVEVTQRPSFLLPEVIFIGRSNVGKSSLINALTQIKGLAKVSTKPGKTRYLNYFNVDDTFYLVDAPGFGYTQRGKQELEQFAGIMDTYFQTAQPTLALYLIDGRRVLTEEDSRFITHLNQSMNIVIVFTKVDKLNQSEKAHLRNHIRQLGLQDDQCALVSIHEAKAMQRFRNQLDAMISLKKQVATL